MQRMLIFCIGLLFFSTNFLRAQGAEAPEARFQALEERIRALEAEVQSLKAALPAGGAPAAPAAAAAPLQAPTAPLPVYGGASAAAKALNPDIGIVGSFVGATGRNLGNPYPSLSLQESEVSLQAIVDPYARADFFLAVGEEGIEVEEGYITFPALPGNFLLKAGKMRSTFSRVNTFHNHTLPWIDRPLVQFNLMGGSLDEADVGIKEAGLSLSRLLPAPIFLEATAELFRGDSGSLFQASRRSDVSSVFHLRGYHDLSESTNLEIGGSYARGHNDVGSDFLTQLGGLDTTLRWKPLRRAIYHSFSARSEFVWSRRQEVANTQRAFGFFASAEYQLARRWFGGARFDWSERARNAEQHDNATSLVLTYWPSEFSQIRGQLRRTHYAEGNTANEFLFQFLFTLGAHGAHVF
ncbi:MAG: hypothetical protein A3J28_01975 [Acidobacteria bacterium RIFCSPLOWO2_12_FULL_60_22]|nr:MAG: hypothetical protein A3J28_01975 [Acidobacteria bacterium RIFCSPLOWO2_12_FULL_60_22]